MSPRREAALAAYLERAGRATAYDATTGRPVPVGDPRAWGGQA